VSPRRAWAVTRVTFLGCPKAGCWRWELDGVECWGGTGTWVGKWLGLSLGRAESPWLVQQLSTCGWAHLRSSGFRRVTLTPSGPQPCPRARFGPPRRAARGTSSAPTGRLAISADAERAILGSATVWARLVSLRPSSSSNPFLPAHPTNGVNRERFRSGAATRRAASWQPWSQRPGGGAPSLWMSNQRITCRPLAPLRVITGWFGKGGDLAALARRNSDR
jgi:hypothetical protein